MPEHGMQTSPEQIQFFQLLVELLGVRRALEVGVFTGYSALGVALAMPPDGRLVALDNSEPYTAVARRYWAEAGVAERIELRLGGGDRHPRAVIGEGESGRFDFAFIDADKPNYRGYYEHCLVLLRPGGLLAVDNGVEGESGGSHRHDENTEAIRVFNARISGDERVTLSMLPSATASLSPASAKRPTLDLTPAGIRASDRVPAWPRGPSP